MNLSLDDIFITYVEKRRIKNLEMMSSTLTNLKAAWLESREKKATLPYHKHQIYRDFYIYLGRYILYIHHYNTDGTIFETAVPINVSCGAYSIW